MVGISQLWRSVSQFSTQPVLTLVSFVLQMRSDRHHESAADVSFERKLIRVDVPSDHAGITAALRRAFAAADGQCPDRDFRDLLQKLS
jgi:hypothetical protein